MKELTPDLQKFVELVLSLDAKTPEPARAPEAKPSTFSATITSSEIKAPVVVRRFC